MYAPGPSLYPQIGVYKVPPKDFFKLQLMALLMVPLRAFVRVLLFWGSLGHSKP